VDDGSLSFKVSILGKEGIDEAYYMLLHYGMGFDTIHIFLCNARVHYCGQDFLYLALGFFKVDGLL
jgi:hypothetical protein